MMLEETLNNKLIISDFYNNHMLGFQLEDNKLVRIYDFNSENVVGNVYCGYVKDVVKNINAAFVEFDKDKKGYYLLKDDTKTIHQGDKILIQVAGDKMKTKDYILTSNINLNSSCLVLTVGNTDISISKKINDKNVREQLKETLIEFSNNEFGFILRTNSVNFSATEIKEQAKKLISQWEDIKRKFKYASAKSILLKNDSLLTPINEYVEKYCGNIVTDNKEIYDQLTKNNIPANFNTEDKISLCNKYSLEKHLRESLNKKVWLKSGAYLVIEPTEALTVIDVNTGKADVRGNRENTFKKINTEAAFEIARQIRVRNLSGIIIVDFINMKDKEDYLELRHTIENAATGDFSPCTIVGFTNLGLLEISRKKKEKPLYEIIKRNEEI